MQDSTRAITLIELLITLAISAIIMTASTSLGSYLDQSKARSDANRLKRILSYARNIATLEKKRMVLCALNAQQKCNTNWNQTLTLFADENNNSELDNQEVIHTRLAALETTFAIRTFQRAALIYFPSGTGTSGTLTYCAHTTPVISQALIISRIGRIRPGEDRNHNGIAENASGQDVRCPL